MDREHMDHYGNFDKYREAFREFCNRLPFYGVAVLCAEHPETQALSASMLRRTLLYGFSKNHDWNAQGISYSGPVSEYDLYHKEKYVDHMTLNIPGSHNVLNSLAAIAVANEVGVSFAKIKKALKMYQGVGRRMEITYQGGSVTAVDDYGHHPVEIQATLSAVRQAFTGRLVVLFQPHRFSRTQDLFSDFVNSFGFVDRLLITDIYSAGETPLQGIHSRKMVDAIKKQAGDRVSYLPRNDCLVDSLVDEIKPDDVFLSLGAGDVTKLGRAIAKGLKKKFG
jgi:UDP-N-acetylmuramate--alanine ligase